VDSTAQIGTDNGLSGQLVGFTDVGVGLILLVITVSWLVERFNPTRDKQLEMLKLFLTSQAKREVASDQRTTMLLTNMHGLLLTSQDRGQRLELMFNETIKTTTKATSVYTENMVAYREELTRIREMLTRFDRLKDEKPMPVLDIQRPIIKKDEGPNPHCGIKAA
jgi:hypothetical protein